MPTSPLGAADVQLLGVIQAAAIPTRVLLSKVDLLGVDEERAVAAYVAEQLRSQLGVDTPVHPVSVVEERARLLDSWFQDEIAPLYEKHQELRRESIERKIGLLREAVEQSLSTAVQRAGSRAAPADAEALREAEKELRSAAGLFTETEARCLAMSDEIRNLHSVAIDWATSRIIESWIAAKAEGKMQSSGKPSPRSETSSGRESFVRCTSCRDAQQTHCGGRQRFRGATTTRAGMSWHRRSEKRRRSMSATLPWS